ncbi:MAG TPA: hypothetical protein VF292_11720, partial [Rhodanobacteraceae bacterium]
GRWFVNNVQRRLVHGVLLVGCDRVEINPQGTPPFYAPRCTPDLTLARCWWAKPRPSSGQYSLSVSPPGRIPNTKHESHERPIACRIDVITL